MSNKPSPDLEALGLLFVQARTRQNFDMEELSAQLRIPGHYLTAIEQGQTGKLPEPVYVRGFVRKYAQALGLDQDPLVLDFLNQKTPLANPPAKVLQPASPPPTQGKPSPVLQWALYGLVVSVLVVGLTAAFNTYLPQLTAFPPPAPVVEPTLPPPNPTLASDPPPKPVAPIPKPSLSLAMKLTDASWMRVDVDGKTQFVGIVPKGATRQWQAQKKLQVRVGNAGAVILTYNDQVIGPAGKPGQAITRVFEPK